MKKIAGLSLFALTLISCTPFNPGGAYSDIEGRVYSLKYRMAIKDAKVEVLKESVNVNTKEDGNFFIKGLPTKWLTLQVAAPGHSLIKREVKVEPYGVKHIDFWLAPFQHVPDIQPIVFERNDNIWLTDEFGITQLNLTLSASDSLYYSYPCWYSDKSLIAYLGSNLDHRGNTTDGIFTMAKNGMQNQRIVDLKTRAFSLRWAPVQGLFIFSMPDVGSLHANHLFIFDKPKGVIDDLTGKVITREDHPDWSNDGSRIVYTSFYSNPPIFYYEEKPDAWSKERQQIFIMNKKGGERKQLTVMGENYEPSFSPDGTKIAFVSNRTNYTEIWTMDADGNNQKQLTFTYTTRCNRPIWSRDGEKLLFNSNYLQKYQSLYASELWVINTDGKDLRMVTNDAVHADW